MPIFADAEPRKPTARRRKSPGSMFSIDEDVRPPPGPPHARFSTVASDSFKDIAAVARRSVRECLAKSSETVYPDVWTCLGFRAPTTCSDLVHYAGSTLALNSADAYRKPFVQRPLWRKRETVVHERIVQYTTVDADGTIQELVESERSQNEVVHLECKETGEFAHRESSEYEQLETFNNEVVTQERGNEQYLHMKSRDDEYEHLESNMPPKKQAEAAAAAEAEAAAAAAAAEAAVHQEEEEDEALQLSPKAPSDADEETRRWWAQQQDENGGPGEGNAWASSPGNPEVDPPQNGWWSQQQQQGAPEKESKGHCEHTERGIEAEAHPLDLSIQHNPTEHETAVLESARTETGCS